MWNQPRLTASAIEQCLVLILGVSLCIRNLGETTAINADVPGNLTRGENFSGPNVRPQEMQEKVVGPDGFEPSTSTLSE